jgi:hypothetical protein
MPRMKRLLFPAIALVFVALNFAGCGPSATEQRARVERIVKEDLTKSLAEKKIAGSVKEVQLTKETPSTYAGFATMNDGSQMSIKVTVGNDGRIIIARNPI